MEGRKGEAAPNLEGRKLVQYQAEWLILLPRLVDLTPEYFAIICK